MGAPRGVRRTGQIHGAACRSSTSPRSPCRSNQRPAPFSAGTGVCLRRPRSARSPPVSRCSRRCLGTCRGSGLSERAPGARRLRAAPYVPRKVEAEEDLHEAVGEPQAQVLDLQRPWRGEGEEKRLHVRAHASPHGSREFKGGQPRQGELEGTAESYSSRHTCEVSMPFL